MDRLLIRIHFIGISFVDSLFFEGYCVVNGIINQLNHISCFILKCFMFAVELHFVTIPRVPIWTYQVVAVTCTCVTEIEFYSFYTIQMTYAHSHPWGHLFDLHFPLFYWASVLIGRKILLRLGSRRTIRWLPLVVMLALVGLWMVMQLPFSSSENLIFNLWRLVLVI